MDRKKIFLNKETHYNSRIKTLDRAYNLYATIRVIVFLGGLAATIYFASIGNGGAFALALATFLVVFALVVKRHNRISHARKMSQHLAKINRDEILRLSVRLDGFPDGSMFHEDQHAYAKDMDLFGRNSLFQLINRTTTPMGARKIAGW
ncbi:MAG: hypothetical protein R3345_05905, partial [Fulvivirga sp.]|nr:hypothetical protein [Fulvivirga sp.]